MYPSPPDNPPDIPDDPCISRTHRVVADDSNCDLQVSSPANGPTRSYGRAEAESGESGASNMLYMDYRWCSNDPEAQYAQARLLESIEANRAYWTAHLWQSTIYTCDHMVWETRTDWLCDILEAYYIHTVEFG